jgi:lipopolysaccharide biosynthesis regulator YciM
VSEKIEGNITLEQIEREYKEAIDIFPALHKYKDQHNTANLQKLCVEVVDFVRAIYSSTQNEQEREILRKSLDKLKNL